MVGLRNRSTWEPLLLKASCIKSCANGCSMGISAQLTYANAGVESVEGVFVYPLGEKEVVVGFEAAMAGRMVGVQIQSRGKLKDCCLDCCPGSGSGAGPGVEGHLLLDEDLERTTFIVGIGVIGPMDIVSTPLCIFWKSWVSDWRLKLRCEAVFFALLLRATSCFGSTSGKPDRASDPEQQCVHSVFTSPAVNLAPYELNFQLLVRGACLLAGLESPTHALRADADPSAQSASATYITLAQEHPYDRHIEIILHLSESHSPLVILEKGRLSFSEYEQLICSRRDFIRCTRKDPDPERKVFVRKRYHKDVLSSPVLMLNFCPDLHSRITGDTERSPEGLTDPFCLPPGTMLNIVGFGTTIKPLFTSSKLCTDVSMMFLVVQKKMTRISLVSDMRGTNLLGALSWLYQQPMQRSYPRQVFIITDGSIGNVAKVLELVRRNACSGRCFGVGLGPRACRRLLLGVAKLTGGTTEFSDDEERLQPKLIKSLKKAFEPVLTDVRIDWYLPENMEALLSPSEIPPLYPGDRLIGYCTLYDMTLFKTKQGLHGGSSGSVFGQSNDELSPPPASELMPVVTCADGADLEEALREISREISSEFSCARDTDPGTEPDGSSDVRRRIQETSYIQEQYILTRCSLSSERSLQTQSQSHIHASTSDSAGGGFRSDSHSSGGVLETGSLPQGLEKMRQKALARSTMAARSFSSPQGELEMHRLRRALERVSFDQTLGGKLEENGLLFPASPLDWDSFTDPEYLFTAAPSHDPPPGQCRSLIHGMLSGRPVSWEVTVDLGHLWTPEGQELPEAEAWAGGQWEGRGGDRWEEIIHQLTARSVIRDFEKMAEKDAGHGQTPPSSSALTPQPLQISLLSKTGLTRLPVDAHSLKTEAVDAAAAESGSSQLSESVVCPQVRLQLASGAFLLTETYSECVQIPLDRLRRASPYGLHRRSLSPAFRCASPSAPSQSRGQADSGRGSETDLYESWPAEPGGGSQLALEDLEGSSWATAVALAWLEHRCAGFFMEWELVAAKADLWLRCQELPEGVDLAGLRGAARQLFLLLRHWDENIKLNMLCYNPNNM
uniref:von Willebrand factor A domain containing 5B2 n=1 Tax=Salarias fasciatus TaxID=181472 RepID=A0A672F507_SALFA